MDRDELIVITVGLMVLSVATKSRGDQCQCYCGNIFMIRLLGYFEDVLKPVDVSRQKPHMQHNPSFDKPYFIAVMLGLGLGLGLRPENVGLGLEG